MEGKQQPHILQTFFLALILDFLSYMCLLFQPGDLIPFLSVDISWCSLAEIEV